MTATTTNRAIWGAGTEPMASHDRTPMACPTCGKILLGPSAIRYHHGQTHSVSLAEIPLEEWAEYVEERADEITNPEGLTFRDHEKADRHPVYTEIGADGGYEYNDA